MAYVKDLTGLEVREVARELHRTFSALRTSPLPIVAAIDGLCLGAGLELAISCDFMLATRRSRFGLPNIHRGIPAIVEAALLPFAIGIQGAREMSLTGTNWSAEKAERRGLVTALHDPEVFETEVSAYAARLAEHAPVAVALQKEILHKWITTDLESAIDFSINSVVLAFGTRDQQARMGAFLERP